MRLATMRGVQKLRPIGEVMLRVGRPFDHRLTFWKPSHFPTPLEAHSLSSTWRTLRFGEDVVGVKAVGRPGGVTVGVFATWDRKGLVDEVAARVWSCYGLGEDLWRFHEQAAADPVMNKVLRRVRGMRMSCPEGTFEAAVVAVLLQNCGVNRSVGMLSTLLARYGRAVEFDGVRLSSFFLPEDVRSVSVSDLEACGLGYRAGFIGPLASFFAGRPWDAGRKDRVEFVRELRTVHGVGPYTASFVSQRALWDRRAMPFDVWNRRIISLALVGHESAAAEDLEDELCRRFPGNEGLAFQLIIEAAHLDSPVTSLRPTENGGT